MARGCILFLLTCAVLTAGPDDGLHPSKLRVNAARVAAEQKAALAWNIKILVGGYESIGSHNPTWDDAARKGLTLTARLWAHDPTRPGDSADQAWYWLHTAVKLGCDDPLVQYLDVQYTRPDIDALEGARQTQAATTRLVPTHYHAYLKSLALVESADSLSLASAGKKLSKQDVDARWNSIVANINRAHDLLPGLFSDPEVPSGQLVDYVNFLFEPGARGGNDRQKMFSRVEEEFVKARSPKDPVLQIMRADSLANSAWDVRGTGWAKDVKPPAMAAFEARLGQAEAEAAKAVAQGWHNFAVVRVMTRVTLGLGFDNEESRQWFELGKRLAPGDNRPYYAREAWLEPRWHGMFGESIAFARELKDTGNWTAELPFVLVTAHQNSTGGLDSSEKEEYMSRPAVCRDVLSLYPPFLTKYPNSGQARGQYVRWLARCGRWDDVKIQLKLIAPDRLRVGAFGGQARYDEIRKRTEK